MPNVMPLSRERRELDSGKSNILYAPLVGWSGLLGTQPPAGQHLLIRFVNLARDVVG